MRMQVQGRQIGIGDAPTAYVMRQLAAAVQDSTERPGEAVEAVAAVSCGAGACCCDAHVHLPAARTASGPAAADVRAALCAERIERQMRRATRPSRDRHQDRPQPIEAVEAPAYVPAAGEGRDKSAEPGSLQPAIVAETTRSIRSRSVGEAAMQMELVKGGFLMFRNDADCRFGKVFRRGGGNAGLTGPANLSAS